MEEKKASDRKVLLSVRLFLCFLCSRALVPLILLLPLRSLPFWPRVAVKGGLCLIAALFVCGWERLSRASALTEAVTMQPPEPLTMKAVLRSSAVRLLRAAPFLLLFLFPSVLMYYCVFDNTSDLKAMRILKNIGDVCKRVVAPASKTHGYDIGCGVLLLAAFLFLILTMIRWHQDVPMDYGKEARPFRKDHIAAWRRTTWQNLLLSLPAPALWLTVLFRTFWVMKPSRSSGLFNTLMTADKTLASMFQSRELFAYLALILLLVYLPCWCVRKWKITRMFAEAAHET